MKTTRRAWMAGAAAVATAGGQTKPLIIDAHCHAGHGQAMEAPWSTLADPEVTLRHMEEAGIDRTVIFPIGNSREFTQANREIAEICERYPGKFIGFAKHSPKVEHGRIPGMLRREVEQLGLRGLKLHEQPTRDVLDAVEALGIPILYHPGKVSQYHMIASAYPRIPFIMAHLGSFASHDWTEHLAAIDVARRYENVYLDTSSVVFTKYLEMAAQELGAEKILFGSDGPEVDSRVELFKVRLLKLSPKDEAKVLGGNIQRLLKGA